MENIILKRNETGAPYYEQLPPDAILAAEAMFYNHAKKPIVRMPYLVHSFRDERFYAFRVSPYFPDPLFKYLLNQDRVYVFSKKQKR